MNIEQNELKSNTITVDDEMLVKTAAHLLNDHAQHLNAVTLKKLETSRHQAVNRLVAKQSGGINQSGGVLQWFGNGTFFDQHRLLAFCMLMAVALLAFFATQQLNKEHSPVVSYEENSDAFLLASELPPEAFADKGFDTWVVSKRE